jgi:hypothetical protein
MSYLSGGHLPGEGTYGTNVERALEYVLKCQKPNGLLAKVEPRFGGMAGHTAAYNHAISALMLCEVYGMVEGEQSERIRIAIEKAIVVALEQQKRPKSRQVDQGGWRYFERAPDGIESDLSITGWYLMFLRAAKNGGFDVPEEPIEQALKYIRRTFNPQRNTFMYYIDYPFLKRTMAGAGIYALSLGGDHDSELARSVAEWLLLHPFDRYNEGASPRDRFHYGVYYCSLAMYQMGDKYWDRFYPVMARTLIANQSKEGSWQAEIADGVDRPYGNVYTTAFCVQALSVPYQLMPIFQR